MGHAKHVDRFHVARPFSFWAFSMNSWIQDNPNENAFNYLTQPPATQPSSRFLHPRHLASQRGPADRGSPAPYTKCNTRPAKLPVAVQTSSVLSMKTLLTLLIYMHTPQLRTTYVYVQPMVLASWLAGLIESRNRVESFFLFGFLFFCFFVFCFCSAGGVEGRWVLRENLCFRYVHIAKASIFGVGVTYSHRKPGTPSPHRFG